MLNTFNIQGTERIV